MQNHIHSSKVPTRQEPHPQLRRENKRRAISVDQFIADYNVGRTTAYRLIGIGKLQSVMIGRRRLILVDSAEALLRSGWIQQ
jgi:hypothetical protein